MKKTVFLIFINVSVFLFSSFVFVEKERSIATFKLKSATTNELVSLSDYKNAKGFMVIFICNKCPMAKFYSKRLNQMDAKYKKLGVPLLAINSMDTLAYAEESFKNMQKKAQKELFTFPYLQDKNKKL